MSTHDDPISPILSGPPNAVARASAALARADQYARVQPQAWITRLPAAAVMAAAEAVDARCAAGETLPLAGLTFVAKDNIDAAEITTTAACPAFAHVPTRAARVVELLCAAGAVLLGKANLDQFATGLSGARSPYGVPHCVYNRDYISGGSSSGSAVLVAAGVVDFALGTDTAGSGRVPAAINGLIGFKPTRGRWSTRGVVPACRSLDCVSVFSRELAVAHAVDAVLAAFDPEDPYSRAAPAAVPAVPQRIGVASELDFSGDSESAALYAGALERLRATGAELVPVDIAPLLEVARLLYSGPWVAERLEACEDLLVRDPAAFHPTVRILLQEARQISAADAFRGLHRLQALLPAAAALWAQVDALVLPTAPTIFRIADMLADPIRLNSVLGRYTNFVNLLDMSALAVPAGFRANATGFGVTLIAPAWADAALFALAGRYLDAGPGFAAPEHVDDAPGDQVTLAVVGAHLQGMPLHGQLTRRQAVFAGRARTAPCYRLYEMAGTEPAKPALVRDDRGTGASIELELYTLDAAAFGSFVAEVPPPLAIGTVTLEDGHAVKGFVAEPRAFTGATEITRFGGWRAWLASKPAP